ncbi:gp436 family protein [Marivita sp.]|uniref:gp436 family protein n=1 Tax=Marivita sp. TaxID=2003365 RepID=UPI003F6EAABA
MAYATRTDMMDAYGERLLVDLTDRGDVATGLIDDNTLDQALDHASAEIDGYMAARYVLPLSEVPRLVTDLTCALAVWRLHTNEPSGKIKADYEAAQKKLLQISDGKLRLPGATGIEPAGTGAGGARVTDRERPMTEDNLKSFI